MSNAIQPSDVVSTELDNEVVLVNMTSKYYYTLNETGRLIWKLLGEGKNENEIVCALMESYEIEEGTARSDVAELVSDLRREKLIN
jgi:hypothetical protein